MNRLLLHHLYRLGAIGGKNGPKSPRLENLLQRFPQVAVVVGD